MNSKEIFSDLHYCKSIASRMFMRYRSAGMSVPPPPLVSSTSGLVCACEKILRGAAQICVCCIAVTACVCTVCDAVGTAEAAPPASSAATPDAKHIAPPRVSMAMYLFSLTLMRAVVSSKRASSLDQRSFARPPFGRRVASRSRRPLQTASPSQRPRACPSTLPHPTPTTAMPGMRRWSSTPPTPTSRTREHGRP